MSDRMRWRYGDTNPVVAAVDEETVVEIGDLVWQDGDDAKRASQLLGSGTPDENRGVFLERFLGVAMQRSRRGETAPIRVATTGVFEFDCASSAFELGDLIGPAASGDSLLDQQVVKVLGPAQAVGRAARREPAAGTRVLVDIRSAVMTGGVPGSVPASD